MTAFPSLAPARPRRYGFALTPLADAMFQLLVFFMLSSSLAPYSLVPLTGGTPPATTAAAAALPQQEAAADVTVWHLSRGRVRIGDDLLTLSDLSRLLPQLRANPDGAVLILPASSATVQDLARVSEVLALAGVRRVEIVAGSRADGGG